MSENRSFGEWSKTHLLRKRRNLFASRDAPAQRSSTLWGLRPSLCRHRADDHGASAFPLPLLSSSLFPSPCPSVFSLLPLSLPLASPAHSRFRSAAVCGRVSRLFRLYSGGGGGSGACASSVRVSRRVPWVVHLRVAEPRRGGRWRWTITRRMKWMVDPPVLPGAPLRTGDRITRPSNSNGCRLGSPSLRLARCYLPSLSSASSSSPLASVSSSPPTTSARSRWGEGVAVGVGVAPEPGPPRLLHSSLSSLEVDRLALPSPASSLSSSVSPFSFCVFPEFCSFVRASSCDLQGFRQNECLMQGVGQVKNAPSMCGSCGSLGIFASNGG